MWVRGMPMACTEVWQVRQVCAAPAAGATTATVAVPARRAGPTPVRGVTPVAGFVVVAVVDTVARGRTASLSRELWQPDPPQSWPVWWPLGRVHKLPLVFHVMPF